MFVDSIAGILVLVFLTSIQVLERSWGIDEHGDVRWKLSHYLDRAFVIALALTKGPHFLVIIKLG